MKTRVFLYLGAIAALGGLAAWIFLGDQAPPLTPEELRAQALQAPELSEKLKATATLSTVKDPSPIPYLREVLGLSPDSEVVVQAIDGLAAQLDHESVPLFIGKLNDGSPAIRQAAYVALLRLYGGALPDKITYKSEAPAADRIKAASRLKKVYDEEKATKLKTKT